MVDLALGTFVEDALGAHAAAWDEDAVRALASKAAPPGLAGSAEWLVRGDMNSLWARWFLEGIADPQPYVNGKWQYAHLYQHVREHVAALTQHIPADEQSLLAKSLARLLWLEIERRRSVGRRTPADRELRLLLWELYPRCWICGALFDDWAKAAFLGESSDREPSTLPFIDFYKPRGARRLDLRVEIEHVVSHSSGGGDDPTNLRLACGWCNRAKSSRFLLYDAEGAPQRRKHPRLGVLGVPQPFWVVRFLAMRGRCEDLSGCPARTMTHELTVAPRNPGGAPNPANLSVVCRDHDPFARDRLVAARYIIS